MIVNVINYWHKYNTGQLTLTAVEGQLVIRKCVGRGRGQDQIRLYPLYYDIPEGDDTEYEDDFFAELLRFLYVTAGDSSASDGGDTAPNDIDPWEREEIYDIFRFQGKVHF